MEYISHYKPTEKEKSSFMVRTYAWMAFALILSAGSAFFFSTNENLMARFWSSKLYFYILAGVELVLVWTLSIALKKISVALASLMFMTYSIINGITLSSIFWIFDIHSIGYCFIATSVMFLLMSIYGIITKQSLVREGHYLMMALIGLIIVTLVNSIVGAITHVRLGFIEKAISIVTVVIFTGLTAYDSQKIIKTACRADNSDAFKKLSIVGALELYLDFINIFLSLLRLFGKSRD